jgi:hypothetical protein
MFCKIDPRMTRKMMMPTSQRMMTVSEVDAFSKNEASLPSCGNTVEDQFLN